MFDSIANVNDYLSEHWLAEVFPSKLRDLASTWKELAAKGKQSPVRGLATLNGGYLADLASLPEPTHPDFRDSVTQVHQRLLRAVGFDTEPTTLDTAQAETPISVPLLGRISSPTSTDALHILQAAPVDSVDALLGDDAELLAPVTLAVTSEKAEELSSVPRAITQLFISDDPPRYLVVVAGGAVLVTDAARWSEGRYLAFDVATALDRRDDKATGELAFHAGLWSADVLLPNDDGKTTLDIFTEDSEKHAVGVSEDLREGLRISIEKIANEVLAQRRLNGLPVEGIPELPRDLTTQSLRFLYRILFLLFAEARPELGILPVGAPEYSSGYGLDRLREIIQVPLTGPSADGHHLHDSLNLLFRLVNDGHNADSKDGDGLVFEAMRSDLFDKKRTPLIDEARLSNRVLQEVLTLLLLSKPSKNKNKQRGYISYAQLGINQLGAVYEGLMSYSGLMAEVDMVEVAKDGDADKGSWLVPSVKSGDYDEKDLVWREDRLTGRKDIVRHPKGSFVFRLSGRDRQRSASYYTPEVLTKCVVKHALAELIDVDTKAMDILEYRICEPALGSGAFLNEAINQLAAEYLNRRQDEMAVRIDPESYATELQKVKAYIALHRAYGVDLNSTAVELAEVSLWLNVMHRGLQAPWFGLHLRRGNSLIGARRATYDFTSLGRAKKSWLKTPPIDRPLSEGAIGEGEIHHFLLPAEGWGIAADGKQAKELAPEQAAAMKKWRSEVLKKPSVKQLERLRALSRRVERLWELSLRRLEISEIEVARDIAVWGADRSPVVAAATREDVEKELLDPEGPYMRLRLAMDAWSAMWFWPLSESEQNALAPPGLDEWISTLEGLLGAEGVSKRAENQTMFHETIDSFPELSKFDELERQFFGMQPIWRLIAEHEWLGTARSISADQGFFHWDLDFGNVFRSGGFDLQVGNPPWVRPIWDELAILSEWDPYLGLVNNIPDDVIEKRREKILSKQTNKTDFLLQAADVAATTAFLRSSCHYPEIAGLQLDLYLLFILRCWYSMKTPSGIVGLLHQEGHFTDTAAGALRALIYQRLRVHAQFSNKYKLFPEISTSRVFSLNIYSTPSSVDFMNMSDIYSVSTFDGSVDHNGYGPVPNMQSEDGRWNITPHRSRVSRVSINDLNTWVVMFDPEGTPPLESRLVKVFTQEHLAILRTLGDVSARMSDCRYRVSTGWHEKGAKEKKIIEWKTVAPASVDELIMQGNHLTPGNPYSNQPRWDCVSRYDWDPLASTELGESFIPRVNYVRRISKSDFLDRYDHWPDFAPSIGSSACDFWRVAWRNMVDLTTERSLQAAIIPPGATHVDIVSSLSALSHGSDDQLHVRNGIGYEPTAVIAGLWASIPYDYLVKVSGKSHVNADLIKRFPAPLSHCVSSLIQLRALRLNCLTRDFKLLWEELFDQVFLADQWSSAFSQIRGLGDIAPAWSPAVPLRTEFERRAALVELDALAALALGMSFDQLAFIYRAQFPVLVKYEKSMFFDSLGSRICKHSRIRGAIQQPNDYEQLMTYLDSGQSGDMFDRYTPFPADDLHPTPWFYKADREAEMGIAYDEFQQKLGLT